MFYSGIHIMLQYLNQLPVSFPSTLEDSAEYIGLYKISLAELGWPESIQGAALITLFMLVL